MRQERIEAEALVVGYAMSRLGKRYLEAFGHKTWRSAYQQAGKALGVPNMSVKNLRDEFDPYVSKERVGWHNRPIRQTRQTVMDELSGVSDLALLELATRFLTRDIASIEEVVDLVLAPPKRIHNVAERLLTGRLAEEFFLSSTEQLLDLALDQIVDVRQLACGYDFGVRNRLDLAIEVKGLKNASGSILFTDREWSEAAARQSHYWVVVVGNLSATPRASVIKNPIENLIAKCEYTTTTSASWRAQTHV